MSVTRNDVSARGRVGRVPELRNSAAAQVSGGSAAERASALESPSDLHAAAAGAGAAGGGSTGAAGMRRALAAGAWRAR